MLEPEVNVKEKVQNYRFCGCKVIENTIRTIE